MAERRCRGPVILTYSASAQRPLIAHATEETTSDASSISFVRISTGDPIFITALRDHYTGSQGPPVGKKMAWEILEQGIHRGWVGAGEPPFKLAALRRLGLNDAKPPPGSVSNFIYRIDAPGAVLASAILRKWHDVLVVDWKAEYGWAPEHVLSMVDPTKVQSSVPGACFRKAGYRSLGKTTGLTVTRPKGMTKIDGPRVWGRGTPKLVLYWGPLVRVPIDARNARKESDDDSGTVDEAGSGVGQDR